jgi:hypothetical protein
MTNIPDHNRPAFDAAAKRLRGEGHFVINPAELSAMFGTAEELECSFFALYELEKPQNAYTTMSDLDKAMNEDCAHLARAVMDADLAAVRSCDAIYLLRGWESSRGAKKELAEALAHGLQVMQEGGGE